MTTPRDIKAQPEAMAVVGEVVAQVNNETS